MHPAHHVDDVDAATAAHRSAISFENEIIVASSAFEAYLIISAVACWCAALGTPANRS